MTSISWKWQRLDQMFPEEIYHVLQARQKVFLMEQNCLYQDCDGYDLKADHLTGYDSKTGHVAAYLRVLPAGQKYPEISFGRVLTTSDFRGKGMGSALIKKGLEAIQQAYGPVPIRISAQQYLEKFYQSFGFEIVSAPYLEDNIPHIEMLRHVPH